MTNLDSDQRKIVLAAMLGAVAGGLGVVVATRAIPKMMSQIMAGMMRTMMAQMRSGDGGPPSF